MPPKIVKTQKTTVKNPPKPETAGVENFDSPENLKRRKPGLRPETILGAPQPCLLTPTLRIRARINVGHGNHLSVYGNWQGDSSWEKGIPMTCILPDLWEAIVPTAGQPTIEFKIKLNDSRWEAGYNHIGYPGKQIEVTPQFSPL